MFTQAAPPSGGLATGVDLLVLDKWALVAGPPTINPIFSGFNLKPDKTGRKLQPVVNLDPDPDSGFPEYLLSYDTDTINGLGPGPLKLSTISGPIGSPIVCERDQPCPILQTREINVWPVTGPPPAVQPGQQTGQNGNLDTGGSEGEGPSSETSGTRFTASVVQRNGTLWGVQSAKDPDTGRAVLRWFEVDPLKAVVLQSGFVSDPKGILDFYYGSIAVNQRGDVVIGFNGSGGSSQTDSSQTDCDLSDTFSNRNPEHVPRGSPTINSPQTRCHISSFAVVGHTSGGMTTFCDPLLLTGQTRTDVAIHGTATYEQCENKQTGERAGSCDDTGAGPNRWGDYSATTVDPTNPLHFWTIQEIASGKDTWSTLITKFELPGRQSCSTTNPP
jgi:hypothetical protein